MAQYIARLVSRAVITGIALEYSGDAKSVQA
jgi:hypothetical protein